MGWWGWALLALLIVLFVLAISSIKLQIYYSRAKNNDRFFAHVRALFGLIRLRFDVPLVKFQSFVQGIAVKMEQVNDKNADLLNQSDISVTREKIIRFYKQIKQILEATLGMRQWLKESLAYVRCTELKWDTRIGLGDAPETAITTGIVWSLKSSLLTYAFKFVRRDMAPQIRVTPQFNQTHFSTEFSCILQIRVGHVIMAGVHLLIRILKVKGGIKVWQKILTKVLQKKKLVH